MIVEGSSGYRASIRGTFVLSRNPGYKACTVALWLNVAYPEVIVQVRDIVLVVDIVAPFALRGQY